MKRKAGFTLVEMLIVVVIIGILASALLPKLTGYMARTRDIKRHADLRNVAAAIEMYYNNYGEFPYMDTGNLRRLGGSLQKLSSALSSYMSSLPQDPQKNNSICIHNMCLQKNQNNQATEDFYYIKGEYLYQRDPNSEDVESSFTHNPSQKAILIAKVETPEYANYVLEENSMGRNGGNSLYFWKISTVANSKGEWPPLEFCDTVNKGSTTQVAVPNNHICTYISEKQLYFIMQIQ